MRRRPGGPVPAQNSHSETLRRAHTSARRSTSNGGYGTCCCDYHVGNLSGRLAMLPASRWLARTRRVARVAEQISHATAAHRLGGGMITPATVGWSWAGSLSCLVAGLFRVPLAWMLHLPPSAVPLVSDVRFRRSAQRLARRKQAPLGQRRHLPGGQIAGQDRKRASCHGNATSPSACCAWPATPTSPQPTATTPAIPSAP
jgi:hypothetical protein